MILLIARHGETAWNEAGRSQGQSDIPLNDHGRSQATALARRLAHLRIDALYASDLSRARETAAIVGKGRGPGGGDLKPTTDPRLRETALGKWEGLHRDELTEHFAADRDAWQREPASFKPEGGESLMEVQERMVASLTDIATRHHGEEERVLVVSHGYATISFVCHVLDLDLNRFRSLWLDPTGVTRVHRENGRWSLRGLNDTSHLERDI